MVLDFDLFLCLVRRRYLGLGSTYYVELSLDPFSSDTHLQYFQTELECAKYFKYAYKKMISLALPKVDVPSSVVFETGVGGSGKSCCKVLMQDKLHK